jgi:thioredoxin 1
MPTIKVTDESFEKDVLQNKMNVICDFWAPWCSPCLQIAPVLEEISDEMKDQIVICKHNIDDSPNMPSKYGVRGIPTMLLFSNGQLKSTKVGATSKSNIISWIKENS